MNSFVNTSQVIVAVGLLNVWLLRTNKATAWRGGEARNMHEEFAVYGLPDWFMWLVLHLMFLIGFRNRFVVAFQWFIYLITYQRGARLITFQDSSSPL